MSVMICRKSVLSPVKRRPDQTINMAGARAKVDLEHIACERCPALVQSVCGNVGPSARSRCGMPGPPARSQPRMALSISDASHPPPSEVELDTGIEGMCAVERAQIRTPANSRRICRGITSTIRIAGAHPLHSSCWSISYAIGNRAMPSTSRKLSEPAVQIIHCERLLPTNSAVAQARRHLGAGPAVPLAGRHGAVGRARLAAAPADDGRGKQSIRSANGQASRP